MISSTFVMLFKILLVVLLLVVVINLMRALFQFSCGQKDGRKLSHFLGRRVLFSAIAVLLLLLAMGTGLIIPNPRPY